MSSLCLLLLLLLVSSLTPFVRFSGASRGVAARRASFGGRGARDARRGWRDFESGHMHTRTHAHTHTHIHTHFRPLWEASQGIAQKTCAAHHNMLLLRSMRYQTNFRGR